MKGQDKEAEILIGSGGPEDEWLDDTRGYRVRKTHLELLQLIPSQGQLILDAGCGPGTYGIILAQKGNQVIGVEISPESVALAKERATKKGVRFSPMVGDLERLPFKDNSFDTCFCGWVLHHFPDMDAAVAEFSRVLKSGGKIALTEPNESNIAVRFSRFIEDLPLIRGWVLRAGWDTPNRTIHRHNDYIKALERQGFTDIEVSSCFPGGLPPLPARPQKWGLSSLGLLLIHILVRLRRLYFIIAVKVLSYPLNGADLLIKATKSGYVG
ncbi:class I SAM-dependent methyltransferase [Chloroflexota bacterium]